MEAGRIILRREDGGAAVQPQPEVDQHRALQQTPVLNVSDIYLSNVAHIEVKINIQFPSLEFRFPCLVR